VVTEAVNITLEDGEVVVAVQTTYA